MTEIKIPLSKTKLVLLLIGGLAFVFGGVWMIIKPQASSYNRYSEDFLFFIGLACILFFGLSVFFIVKKILSRKTGLIINDKGILDNSNAIDIGLIEWKDISGMDIIKVKVPVHELGIDISSQKMIILKTNKAEKYIERQKNLILRETMEYNNKEYGSPLTIISNGLNIKFSELENLITREIKNRKK
ncbi:STM3941 family protein [Psychroserpens damuponensis]|uniref:STM3941 family protein n=1 Tax=Psychroserpens damuponensis TaxID=943936 RepID=UPI00058C72E3|nr:STM3941 family protein [Psychroserpens damuponensis]